MATEEHNSGENEAEQLEVLELESDDGEIEECVVIDSLEYKGKEYLLMALLEDLQNLEEMEEDAIPEVFGEENIFFVLRREGETYLDPTDEELDEITPELEALLEKKLE